MSSGELLRKASDVLGRNEEGDYILEPVAHAEMFKDVAPELSSVLGSSEAKGLAEEYEIWNSRAIEAQQKFDVWSNRALWSIFLAACSSAALLTVGGLRNVAPDKAKLFVLLFALGAVAASSLAAACLNRIRSGRLLEVWMANRAEAEMFRLEYFSQVTRMRSPRESSSAIPLPLLLLEYFRRFQLDVQLSYYETRGRQQGRDAEKSLTLTSWAMLGVAAANGAAGVLVAQVDPLWSSLAGLAIAAQAFASLLASKEAFHQGRRNSERYERTRRALSELRRKLDEVRQRIFTGEASVLDRFVEAVHEQLSLEHRQWTETFKHSSAALVRLEQELQAAKSRSEQR
jgi:hypothetical protein